MKLYFEYNYDTGSVKEISIDLKSLFGQKFWKTWIDSATPPFFKVV